MKTCTRCGCQFGRSRLVDGAIMALPDEPGRTLCDACDPPPCTVEQEAALDELGMRAKRIQAEGPVKYLCSCAWCNTYTVCRWRHAEGKYICERCYMGAN